MKTALYCSRQEKEGLQQVQEGADEEKAGLVLCFAAKSRLNQENWYSVLRKKFPLAHIVICSTAGEICSTSVLEEAVSVAALEFGGTTVQAHTVNVADYENSFEAGRALMRSFNPYQLQYVLVISDGEQVNGTGLVKGMNAECGTVLVTGGLAGDGNHFRSTLVGVNDTAKPGVIAAIGFYGNNIKIGHGSKGGWETFGLEKSVTRSVVNVLYEIEGKNALEMYKHYLGTEAAALPWAALLFPLSVVLPDTNESVVRTILSIDEEAGSMTFAGDIPEGARIRFMRANFDRLTNAAYGAAQQSLQTKEAPPQFALLISCVGRKLVLQSRTEEEVEAVDDVFNHHTALSGFYSYGELSPLVPGGACQLHNQTMTITTFHEME